MYIIYVYDDYINIKLLKQKYHILLQKITFIENFNNKSFFR